LPCRIKPVEEALFIPVQLLTSLRYGFLLYHFSSSKFLFILQREQNVVEILMSNPYRWDTAALEPRLIS
jgi:hypothetical protein